MNFKSFILILLATFQLNIKAPLFPDKVRLSSIHEAVRYGDVLELQAMVQRGAGINDVDSKFKFTPLHWAAHHGSLEVRMCEVLR